MHASLRSHGQSLRELHSLLVEHLPRGTNAALQRLHGCATRCEPPQAEVLRTSQRQRQTGAASPRPEGSGLGVALPRGGGGVMGRGGGSVRGSQGGVHPGGFFDSSRRIFRRIFLADFSFVFCDQKKNPPQNPPQNPPLRGEFLFQKSPGLEAPEIHRPPPPPGRANPSPVPSGLGPSLFRVGVSRKRLQV